MVIERDPNHDSHKDARTRRRLACREEPRGVLSAQPATSDRRDVVPPSTVGFGGHSRIDHPHLPSEARVHCGPETEPSQHLKLGDAGATPHSFASQVVGGSAHLHVEHPSESFT